ncbi:E3 ubiquitin-protein ligase MARCHF3-like isoform X2 [Ornithodoros turicata]|uniref:E3 ubiquitin-protein ligase MARCHF3-like isoform X2 n=1 Tax=Ornithodoros turicata TaxID=34597 RepID=UPI00313A0F5A
MAANRRSRGGSALSCRLCFRGQEVDYLFLPCLCTGDAGLVHRGCIERALLQNGNESCATCGYRFKIKTKTKSMFLWLVSSDRRQEAVFFMLNTFGSIGDVLAFTLAWLKALSYLNSPLGPAVPALVAVGFLVVLSFFWALFVGYRFCGVTATTSVARTQGYHVKNVRCYEEHGPLYYTGGLLTF